MPQALHQKLALVTGASSAIANITPASILAEAHRRMAALGSDRS
jgi:NADP-dependent 3-hydroxy acid dehydrogenase YdfG